MSVIEEIRNSITEHNNPMDAMDMEKTLDIILNYRDDNFEDRKVDIVLSETKDIGEQFRYWDNTVYEVEAESEKAYFLVEKEIHISSLENEIGCIVVKEVVPKIITTTIYEEKL